MVSSDAHQRHPLNITEGELIKNWVKTLRRTDHCVGYSFQTCEENDEVGPGEFDLRAGTRQ